MLIVLSPSFLLAQNLSEILIPYPKECKIGVGNVKIDSNLSYSINGNPNKRIFRATENMMQRLKDRTGTFLKQNLIANQESSIISIDVKRPGVVKLGEDESYNLIISNGKIIIRAETDLGGMHALETLLQLIQSDDKGYFFPNCTINDSPRFGWRGLMIDVSRHFMPIEVIKRNIDGMVTVKMNVLHIHLTDDQGIRVECKTFPKLNQLGSEGKFFTHDQIREIIKYADDRGIRVIPEFDMPGHGSSWAACFPELASGNGPYAIETQWGIFNPTLNPIKPETYTFLDAFLKEMAALFTDDYIHIGGDENSGKEWDDNQAIQDFKKANNIPDNHHLQAYFNQHILGSLTHYGKKMIGWDEVMQPTLPKDIVIQSWRGKQGLIDAARNGFPVILSNGFYIDLIHPASDLYVNEPLPEGIALTDEQKKLILGGEATMWAEMVTEQTIDSRIWPRTAAIAERLWSPSDIIDINIMYKKLDRISIQLEESGLMHEKNYSMMLRRLAGDNDILALKTFIDILEPLKNYERGNQEIHFTSYSPYSRTVDAARPDSKVARKFNSMVDQLLLEKTSDKIITLDAMLLMWYNNYEVLKPIIDKSPILKEMESLSEDLKDVSKIGQEALQLLKQNKSGSESWKTTCLAKIAKAKVSRGQTELMILSGIQKLVEAAVKK